MEIIDKVAPVENKKIKINSQEWFDSEISEKLIIRDKLTLQKTVQYNVQNPTAKKKKDFLKTNSKSVSVNLKNYGSFQISWPAKPIWQVYD